MAKAVPKKEVDAAYRQLLRVSYYCFQDEDERVKRVMRAVIRVVLRAAEKARTDEAN